MIIVSKIHTSLLSKEAYSGCMVRSIIDVLKRTCALKEEQQPQRWRVRIHQVLSCHCLWNAQLCGVYLCPNQGSTFSLREEKLESE